MRRYTCMLGLVVAAHGGYALGQSDLARFERQLDQIRRETLLQVPPDVPAGQRVLFDYGGYLILDYLSVDDERGDNHGLRQVELLGFARVNLDGAHEFFVRGFATYQDYNPGDSFDGEGDGWEDSDFDRAYYRFDLARHMGAYEGKEIKGNLVVTAGRDLVFWGNGLTIAQVLDGIMLGASAGPFGADLIAGVTPVRTVDFDSSRPDFDFNTRRGFFGGMLSASVGKHRPYVYGLIQRDYNKDETLDVGAVTTRFDYNSYYLGAGATGSIGDRLVYGVEVVREGGDNLSNSFTVEGPFLTPVDQTRDDIEAYAADARIDYLFKDPGNTRASVEVLIASGDDDRLHTSNTFGGNFPDTRDRAFNAFGLMNTGLAMAPAVSNLLMLRVGGSTLLPLGDMRHARRLQVGGDVFVFGKLDREAPIDEPTADERYLGWEPDLFLNWQILSDVTLSLRYGLFFPSSDAFTLDDVRQFFSVGMTFAF